MLGFLIGDSIELSDLSIDADGNLTGSLEVEIEEAAEAVV